MSGVKVSEKSQCDILYWKNPVETGKVLGGALVALLVIKKVNLISLFLKLLYTVLFATASVEFLSKLILNKGLVTTYGIKECPDIAGTIKPYIDEALKQLPVYQAKFRKLVFASSPECSFKAAGVVYIAHKLISFLSLWTIALVSTLATFSVPILYKTYQKEIDAAVEQGVSVAKTKSSEYQKLVQEKATPYVKQLDEKLGPVSGFVKSKIPQSRVTPESTTAKLAADVPLESNEQSTATTSGASFPSVPKTDLKQSVQDVQDKVDDLSVDDLKQEIENNKALPAL
ncbi:Rtn1p [Kluyveromyces lactis]|uniref:Reticulon-like protein n=1 Tax=Kluyveromyces lactis (strain ATCC 8585 / CBS 2359 / DSM 70799 / NBRC 1267 / NRRL Y-1140 / WM37) TaxID=284590 RepID=Q6CT63_KLULA|nr:uncharacterized protein KLLA0_C15081g [Kluyveromyces lactis]CAH01727.1 KLLA0C15081p [Kluyveromyces lactis]|eukprot:XP_452876.1 uncharacterized protein KLLA0_C15081g [Kluyveromyces lactis]